MENKDYKVILIFNSHQFNCFEKGENWFFFLVDIRIQQLEVTHARTYIFFKNKVGKMGLAV
jgi:hypothetical protein